MNKTKLLNLLDNYQPDDEVEKLEYDQLVEFVKRTDRCFDSLYPEGHVTASAWVIDRKKKKVGMLLHRILNRWFQPGGHSDGKSDTAMEALREAREELGIDKLVLEDGNIFDVNVQMIPNDSKRGLGKHLHYDIRFLVIGDSDIPPRPSSSSKEVKWVDINEIDKLTNNNPAIARMVKKSKI